MIRTATQLKAKVRNLSGGDSTKAQTLIRVFLMERFLERIALSQYRKIHSEGRDAGFCCRWSGYAGNDGH